MNQHPTKLGRVLAIVMSFVMAFSVVLINPVDVSAAPAKYVKSLKLSKTKVSVDVSKTTTVTATVKVNKKTANKKVTAKSSNTSVATVKVGKASGKKTTGKTKITITAKKAGTAKITVTTKGKNKKNKKIKKTFNVTVKAAQQQTTPTADNTKINLPAGVSTTNPAVGKGASIQLSTNQPGLTWKSSDPTVATISADGKLTGVTDGKVTIQLVDKDGKVIQSQEIAVGTGVKDTTTDANGASNITFGAPSYDVENGKSIQLAWTITPANADKTVTFSSSDNSIATVTDAGIVVGVSAGKATITATTKSGKQATTTVNVVNPVVITLSATEIEIGRNQTINLSADVANVTWSSDNTEIATVDENGLVKGISAGVAHIIARSGDATASCTVNVSKYDPQNDGVTLSVFNPIKNNDGTVIDNTVLVNQDMVIQAYVQANNTPRSGARVRLNLDPIDESNVNASDYVIKVNGSVSDTAMTNADGIAEFTVAYDGSIDSTYDSLEKCKYISFGATAKVDNVNNIKDDEITVKFASVLRSGIYVDNNGVANERSETTGTTKPDTTALTRVVPDKEYGEIVPFDGHAAGDVGIQQSWNTNNYYPVQYVTSQQVGNDVYLDATPYFILPPTRQGSEDKFEITFPNKEVTTGQDDVEVEGPSFIESYTIYNDGTDETTTTTITNIPAGLVSMSVLFNRISISKYSGLYIDFYDLEAGKRIDGKEITEISNVYDKERGVQLKFDDETKGRGLLVVSLRSPGQVDISTTGYAMSKVTGDFAANRKLDPEEIEVVNSVKWSDVTDNARYNIEETMDYTEAVKYLAEYKDTADGAYIKDGDNYTFAYRVPLFNSDSEKANAITGNALLTATYTDLQKQKHVATYAYPVVREPKQNASGDWYSSNTNMLMPKTTDIKAIFLGEDVLDANGDVIQKTGGLTQEDNIAVVKSAANNKSGVLFAEARITIDALSEEIKSAKTDYNKNPLHGADAKYPLYSYVQFVAKPGETEADGVVPTFHAVEDQYIVVTGEVLAGNTEVQTSQPIEFYYGPAGIKITKADVGQKIGENVTVQYVDTQTNSEGKAYLVLSGYEKSYVDRIWVKYDGGFATFNTYAGDQKFDEVKEGNDKKHLCNLCWLDLGLSYEKDATKPGTWQYAYNSGETKNTSSEAEVDTEWKVGFLPVAECGKGHIKPNFDLLAQKRQDPLMLVQNLFVGIDGVSVSYIFDGKNAEECKPDPDDNSAIITSSKTGETEVYGDLDLKDRDNFKVTYYDADGNLQEVTTVGVNSIGANSATKVNDFTGGKFLNLGGRILYTMTWTPSNWEPEYIYPYGTWLSTDQKSKIYYRLHDKNGNPIVDALVKVSATLDGNTFTLTAPTGPVKTDKDGVVVIEVPDTSGVEGDLSIVSEVDGTNLKSTAVPITYVNNTTEAPLQVEGDPEFDTENHKVIKLKYNNQIKSDGLTPEILSKLFVVEDNSGNKLDIESVNVAVKTVTIVLKDKEFIENEHYKVKVNTGDECKIGGVVYVLYDEFGHAIDPAYAEKSFDAHY